MRAFTDDDLKRLKEHLVQASFDIEGEIPKLTALLARLESAEKVIVESLDYKGKSFIGLDDWHKAYEAWRKSKGEGE